MFFKKKNKIKNTLKQNYKVKQVILTRLFKEFKKFVKKRAETGYATTSV